MSSGGPGWRGWGPGISAVGPGRGWLGTSLRAKTTTWLAGRRLAGGSGRCAKFMEGRNKRANPTNNYTSTDQREKLSEVWGVMVWWEAVSEARKDF
ncbi:hypothetical protein Pcinc_041505 [Petrolisthes cinctipes]|uniref:Uncharacterized protein n=1 Tax=Petrolisthes cinctipes TaxID=88211 RepID=A0AAE1EGW2_PETCI|nr:hypothetical protein Pcinc_041505 [Petrolisthes cinctipes]